MSAYDLAEENASARQLWNERSQTLHVPLGPVADCRPKCRPWGANPDNYCVVSEVADDAERCRQCFDGGEES
jgi:hypothetical protein